MAQKQTARANEKRPGLPAKRRAAGQGGWRDVERHLRHAIEKQEFDVGQQIPTEPELIETYRSTRYAVRRALSNLQKDGLIRIEQGRGTFVHDGYLVSYRLGERPRFTNVLLENHVTPGQEILRIDTVAADRLTAQSLGIRAGQPVLLMDILGYADGQVVKRDTNYFPLPRFRAFEPALRGTNSVTEALAAYGIGDYRRKSTSIVGRLPSPAEARSLRQLPSAPIFEILRVDVDNEGKPILFGITLFSCERVRLTLDI